MGSEFLIKISRYSFLAILFGLFMLGTAGYSYFNAARGGSGANIPARDALQTVDATLKGIEQRTTTVTGRRGRTVQTDMYWAITVQLASGERQAWRLDYAFGPMDIRPLVGQTVHAELDPENLKVYDLSSGEDHPVRYDDVAESARLRAQERADAAKAEAFKTENLLIGIIALLLGVAGVVIPSKLARTKQDDVQSS